MSASEDDGFVGEMVEFTIEYEYPDENEDGEPRTVTWAPPIVTELTANQVGDGDTLVDGCGNRERRSAESASWQVDASGLALPPDVAVLRELELAGEEVTITSEIDTFRNVTVDDVEITMAEGENVGHFPDRNISEFTREQANSRQALTKGLVFSWQIQTEEPDDGEGGFFSS